MKKITLILAVSLFATADLVAQSIQEGINYMYAERYKSAKANFEKMLVASPNNAEATYWLGQAEIEMENVAAAKTVYANALLANANAPLILVGIGQIKLIESNMEDARQHFETAITVSRTRKGDDANILNAVGRANVNSKKGNFHYAIEKLKAAVERDGKNPDIYFNLGNAYRKVLDGSNAVVNYKNALTINPNFAVAYYRMAKIYQTQQNWEVFVRELEDAVAKDPKFGPAYYELYEYNFLSQKYDIAETNLKKYLENTDADIQNDYYYAQLLWKKKDFQGAIGKALNIINTLGPKAKARPYKLIAYSYLDMGDTLNAKKAVDDYFDKEKPENIIAMDYKLKADVLTGTGSHDSEVFKAYVTGAKIDTVESSKIEFLNQGVEYFKNKNKKIPEAEMRLVVYATRTKKYPTDYFYIGLPFYFGKAFDRADSVFKLYSQAFPDSIFGYLWSARSLAAIDTNMTRGLAIAEYEKTMQISLKDTGRFKNYGIEACGQMAGYYNNVLGDKEKAIYYLRKGLEFDPGNAPILQSLLVLEKAAIKQPPKKG